MSFRRGSLQKGKRHQTEGTENADDGPNHVGPRGIVAVCRSRFVSDRHFLGSRLLPTLYRPRAASASMQHCPEVGGQRTTTSSLGALCMWATQAGPCCADVVPTKVGSEHTLCRDRRRPCGHPVFAPARAGGLARPLGASRSHTCSSNLRVAAMARPALSLGERWPRAWLGASIAIGVAGGNAARKSLSQSPPSPG